MAVRRSPRPARNRAKAVLRVVAAADRRERRRTTDVPDEIRPGGPDVERKGRDRSAQRRVSYVERRPKPKASGRRRGTPKTRRGTDKVYAAVYNMIYIYICIRRTSGPRQSTRHLFVVFCFFLFLFCLSFRFCRPFVGVTLFVCFFLSYQAVSSSKCTAYKNTRVFALAFCTRAHNDKTHRRRRRRRRHCTRTTAPRIVIICTMHRSHPTAAWAVITAAAGQKTQSPDETESSSKPPPPPPRDTVRVLRTLSLARRRQRRNHLLCARRLCNNNVNAMRSCRCVCVSVCKFDDCVCVCVCTFTTMTADSCDGGR